MMRFGPSPESNPLPSQRRAEAQQITPRSRVCGRQYIYLRGSSNLYLSIDDQKYFFHQKKILIVPNFYSNHQDKF